MVAGAWPLDLHADDAQGLRSFRERIAGWRQKSLREAKLISSWAAPNEAYEKAWEDFQTRALDPSVSPAFLASLHAYVETIAAAGAANGLVQLALRCMAPGVPDQYQGTEFWDLSFVDPDNRRAVDYAARQRGLAKDATPDALAAVWRSGEEKQHMLRSLLSLRRAQPGPFAGAYEPLAVTGDRKDHVIAFLRRQNAEAILVVGALHMAEPCASARIAPAVDWWGDTRVELPFHVASLEPVVGPAIDIRQSAPIGALLEHLPINVSKLTIRRD
jgi:(1->4)-alpha-D-glucan 1-alpha-D-glucosylmutase